MARAQASWDQLHQAFQPAEVLVGQRSRDLYCEREHSPYERMLRDFRPGLRPVRPPIAFFAGHRGCGKSSLLWRLLNEFQRDYFVVYFDVGQNLDSNKANQIDLLYLLGATIFQVAVQEGIEPEEDLLRGLADSISTLTTTRKETGRDESLDVVQLASGLLCFGASLLGGDMAKRLTEAVLTPFALTAGVSDEKVREREIEPQVQKIVTSVNLIIADVQTKAKRDVLVVVDGLDKLRRLDQAKLIFLESGALTEPVCRIIYTVPMLVFTDLAFGQAEEDCRSYLLPNVKVYEKKSGRKYSPGYEILQDVAAKRLRTVGLLIEDVLEREALDLLIKMSGGVMRWFIGLIQDACSYAGSLGLDKVTREAAQRAVADRSATLAFRLNAMWIEELRKVRRSKLPTGGDLTVELLQSLMIVAYFNGGPWFDAHPLIWEALEE
jgi:hypothetical protein